MHPFKTIHVAGTNGKGSVAWRIAAAYQAAGYKTGLFTSPHIEHFGERIRINGEPMDQETAERVGRPFDHLPFFDRATAMALHYFADQEVDVAIIEVGIGGRLDATNVLSPILTIITSVDLDHCDQLGHTRELIAREKAGICKPGVPCVLGPRAQDLGIHGDYLVAPQANYIAENRAIANCALEVLGINPVEATPPCRFEVHDEGRLIYDAAHNPAGLQALFALLDRPHTLYLGFNINCDVDASFAVIRAHGAPVFLVNVDHERLIPANELRKRAHGIRLVDEPEGECVVVCGSCYIMAEMKRRLGARSPLSDR